MNIILGGTSGLGLEIADLLRERGERVLVMGRDYSSEKYGEGVRVDLFYPDSVQEAVSTLDSVCGDEAPKAFYWLSGYGWRGKFADQPDVHAMAEVNFTGALPIAQWAWKKMLGNSKPSSFVVVSSISGVKPRGDEAVYVATKHAQAGLARSLGIEAANQNYEKTKVALFLPSSMKTGFWVGREPADFANFNDPHKVAVEILREVYNQTEPYIEKRFPKGTLV